MGINLRTVLGRELTYAELDGNFSWFVGTPQTLIISSGVITVTGNGVYLVDTEGAAATDDLTRINGTEQGNWVLLRSVSASRVVTIKQGAFLKLSSIGTAGLDFALTSPYDAWLGWSHGSDVLSEMGRHTNFP